MKRIDKQNGNKIYKFKVNNLTIQSIFAKKE